MMMSTTCGRILSNTRWTTASTNAGSGVADGGGLTGGAGGFGDGSAAGLPVAGGAIETGDDGLGFSVTESLDLNCRLAARSVHLSFGIERAVSSAFCANGFHEGCGFPAAGV